MAFSRLTVSGEGIDLGAKSASSSYYRFLNVSEGTKILFTDLTTDRDNILLVNLEEEIPVADASQDFLILNNVLEHLYDYQTCVSEAFRVLKPNGRLIGAVPFFARIHVDPDDHFRYTFSTLMRLFEEVGFRQVVLTPLGYGPFSAAAVLLAPVLRIRLLIFLLYVGAIGCDRLSRILLGERPFIRAENFPLSYFFVCTK